MTDNDDALKSDEKKQLEESHRLMDGFFNRLFPNTPMTYPYEAAEKEAKMSLDPNDPATTGEPPPDRQTLALESIARSLEKMARPSSRMIHRLRIHFTGSGYQVWLIDHAEISGSGPTIAAALADFDKRFTEANP